MAAIMSLGRVSGMAGRCAQYGASRARHDDFSLQPLKTPQSREASLTKYLQPAQPRALRHIALLINYDDDERRGDAIISRHRRLSSSSQLRIPSLHYRQYFSPQDTLMLGRRTIPASYCMATMLAICKKSGLLARYRGSQGR